MPARANLDQRVSALEHRVGRLETRQPDTRSRPAPPRVLRPAKPRRACPSCHLGRSPRASSCLWCGFVFAATRASE